MSRLRADTMPAVTVPPRLNGLPMATTHSPSRSLSESPNFTAFSVLSVFTRSSARSLFESLPTSCAGSLLPSLRITLISSASAITWLLVTTRPDASMMKPEPSELIAPRRAIGVALSARAAPVLEELLEKLLHRRARRQIGHVAHARVHLLRGRDIDHRIDHLLGDVGDIFGPARRRHGGRQHDDRGGESRRPPRQSAPAGSPSTSRCE